MERYSEAHLISVDAVDRGAAIARLPHGSNDPADIFTLAERSCRAALDGAAAPMLTTIASAPRSNAFAYIRPAPGDLEAVAAVELEIVDDFVDALGRDGRITALVKVLVVDADGEPVARATFDWVVLRRE